MPGSLALTLNIPRKKRTDAAERQSHVTGRHRQHHLEQGRFIADEVRYKP